MEREKDQMNGMTKQGWGYLRNSSKWHYFPKGDRQSLCGKWMRMGPMDDLEDAHDDSAENCVACRRKVEERRSLTETEKGLMMSEWQPIETAPKEQLIVGWCVHDADLYHEGEVLTPYAAGCEGLGHVPDGAHILQWTPDDWEATDEYGSGFVLPGWWTRFGSEGEEYANPTHWMPLPPPPNGD